jgi:hypothetical protein
MSINDLAEIADNLKAMGIDDIAVLAAKLRAMPDQDLVNLYSFAVEKMYKKKNKTAERGTAKFFADPSASTGI